MIGLNGPRRFDPGAGVAPPTPCGARTGGQGPRKRTLWCGHSRTEEKMSTLAASGIATVGTCTSKGMLVIAFIARIARECRAARAGMQRAVCGDAGCVQICVCGQTRAVGENYRG